MKRETKLSNPKLEISDPNPKIVEDFLEIQKKQINNEAEKVELQKMHLTQSSEIAKTQLKYDFEIKQKSGEEKRKNLRIKLIYGLFFFLGFVTFLGFCLHYKESEFAKTFLTIVTHALTLVIGYWFGGKTKKPKETKIDNFNPPIT